MVKDEMVVTKTQPVEDTSLGEAIRGRIRDLATPYCRSNNHTRNQ